LILDSPISQPIERNIGVLAQSRRGPFSLPPLEPCEFEQLLMHAMEILNARELEAQLKAAGEKSGT
jgi:hypothetical protein